MALLKPPQKTNTVKQTLKTLASAGTGRITVSVSGVFVPLLLPVPVALGCHSPSSCKLASGEESSPLSHTGDVQWYRLDDM